MKTTHIFIDQNKKERTRHGTIEFPLAIYTEHIKENILGFIEWHWHDEMQFCVVTQGAVEFEVNQNKYIVREHEIFFINTGQMHHAKNHDNIDSSYLCIDFHSKLLSSFPGSKINTEYIEPYVQDKSFECCLIGKDHPLNSDIYEKLMEICSLYDKKQDIFQIWLNFLQTWAWMIKKVFPNQPQKRFTKTDYMIRTCLDYISEHYAENIVLDTLAQEVGYSKSTCCRIFKNYMNCTLFDYVISYRLNKATTLLLKTDMNITEIAYQCGFGSASYFIKQFKKKSGISPLAYRKQLENKKIFPID